MSFIIGIDIGGSTTKIVGLRDGKITGAAMVRASDPLTSAYGAFGRFLADSGMQLNEIDRVMCTGVGSSFLKEDIYGIPTEKVDEFRAIGLGGRYISGLDHCIVVSMGTGTALTHVCGDQISYINGSGVGGGTRYAAVGQSLPVRLSSSATAASMRAPMTAFWLSWLIWP